MVVYIYGSMYMVVSIIVYMLVCIYGSMYIW